VHALVHKNVTYVRNIAFSVQTLFFSTHIYFLHFYTLNGTEFLRLQVL